MSTINPLIPNDQRLLEYLARAKLPGRIIGHKTAHELATWFAEAIGPGFEVFLATGAVTGPLYTELTRLYDLRNPEAEHWLNNLSRFVVRQPIMANRHRPGRRTTEAGE
jgi:hypothetical protein